MPVTPTLRHSRFPMSGGVADFTWSPALGGLFTFEAAGFTGTQDPQALAWYSMFVVTRGSVTLRRGDDAWTARAGMVALLSPDEIYARTFSDDGCSLIGIFPTVKALAGAGPDMIPGAPQFRAPVVDDPVLASAILAASAPAQGAHAARVGAVLLRLTSHHVELDAVRRRAEHRAVRRLKDLLRDWRGAAPSLTTLASSVSMSRFHLGRIFRDHEGITPYAYFEQQRLARARYLIHAGASLSHAAYATGFTDQSHLTRHFRASLAMTPGVYARAVRAARGDQARARPQNR